VKGVRFQHLRPQGGPLSLARQYEAEGADEIVVLQTDGSTREPVSPRLVRALARELTIPLTVGGGIRSVEQAERLLNAGADRVALNTAAIATPTLITDSADRFGRQAVVLAMDVGTGASGRFEVRARGATEVTRLDPESWAEEAARRGAGEILVTSIDRDGTRGGFHQRLLRMVRKAVPVPIIASGGAAGPASFLEAFRAGADAALAAGIFHDRTTTISAVKSFLAHRKIEVRR
jgi:imidazoleglycerol phosphate synthase cyclase subunit